MHTVGNINQFSKDANIDRWRRQRGDKKQDLKKIVKHIAL